MIKWIKRNQRGILIGAFSGLALTVVLNASGADMSLAVQSAAPLDPIVGQVVGTGKGLADVAVTKVGIALVVLFGTIGGFLQEQGWF